MDTIVSIAAFGILTGLWLAFGSALLLNRALLDKTWQSFRNLPLVLQLVIVLLTLPVVVGLWIWQTRWPIWLRLVLVLALAWTTVYTFFPRFPQA